MPLVVLEQVKKQQSVKVQVHSDVQENHRVKNLMLKALEENRTMEA